MSDIVIARPTPRYYFHKMLNINHLSDWRREWDSNPRIDYRVFMDVRHRPNRLKYFICIQERKLLNKYGRYQYVTSNLDGKHYKKAAQQVLVRLLPRLTRTPAPEVHRTNRSEEGA